MAHRLSLFAASIALSAACLVSRPADACCPAPASDRAVVNADQTVILIWDAQRKRQHFIRRATFSADAPDFGFLVPTPSQPELEEAGDAAFPLLEKLTAPEVIEASSDGGCCMIAAGAKSARSLDYGVTVLEQKTVAGFDAVVLEAKSEQALSGWLGAHGYAFSPEVEAWAKPYVAGGWKITALRVAKDPAAGDANVVAAAALRMSFDTERPLFPYREPDTSKSAAALNAPTRLLRIYFIGDARYDGALEGGQWTGHTKWAGEIDGDARHELLRELRVDGAQTPRAFWLTEIEDPWPYALAPSDVYFARSEAQDEVRREPIVADNSDQTPWRRAALAIAGIAMWLRRRRYP